MKYVWVLVSPLVLALAGLGLSPLNHPGQHSTQHATQHASQHASDGADAPGAVPALGASRVQLASSAPAATPFGFYWQLTTLQPVVPGSVLISRGSHHESRGTRSDKQFFAISSTGSNDVPEAALR